MSCRAFSHIVRDRADRAERVGNEYRLQHVKVLQLDDQDFTDGDSKCEPFQSFECN